ncbi:ANL_collapsed_G0048490.mRNA.1.CDS.1 [Saccharomyces cerevisiae]|nr:ANL_collapsed_G0048490.mRNA.1.CDS.1 [Saccharomyces cerevisiae]
MNTDKVAQDEVQDKVLQRAELAHSVWNLRFNLSKVAKRIRMETKVFPEIKINDAQSQLERSRCRIFSPDLEEEHVPLIQGFKCLDSPPPVPPSSSQGEDEENTVDSQY